MPSSPGFAETTGVAVAMARLAFEQRSDRLGIDAVHHEQLVQAPNTDASASMFCGGTWPAAGAMSPGMYAAGAQGPRSALVARASASAFHFRGIHEILMLGNS